MFKRRPNQTPTTPQTSETQPVRELNINLKIFLPGNSPDSLLKQIVQDFDALAKNLSADELHKIADVVKNQDKKQKAINALRTYF